MYIVGLKVAFYVLDVPLNESAYSSETSVPLIAGVVTSVLFVVLIGILGLLGYIYK